MFEAHCVGWKRENGGNASHGETLASTNEEKLAVSGEPNGTKVGVKGTNETSTDPCSYEIEY